MKNNKIKTVVHEWKKKDKIEQATHHPDVLGAGAKKRKHLHGQEKVHTVMKEFKKGTLHSGGGAKVHNRKQAVAIALSEAGLSKSKTHVSKKKK